MYAMQGHFRSSFVLPWRLKASTIAAVNALLRGLLFLADIDTLRT